MLEQRTNNLPKVVVGGLIYQNKKILICQRKEEGDHPLKWEFPGGKLKDAENNQEACLLYTSPSPRDRQKSRMPSSA